MWHLIFQVFVLVAIGSLLFIHTNSAAIKCQEPKDLDRRFARLNNYLSIRQLLIPHGWSDLEDEFNFLFTITNTHEIRNTCPTTFIKGSYPVMIRSSCPWFIDVDYSDQRYPQTIEFANTRCKYCIGSDGHQECERIHQQIKILKKKDCVNGTYVYEEENFALPIAYSCAQAKEVENSHPIIPPSADLPPPV